MFDRNHGLRPCAVAFAVALALGLSGCGGGANVRSSSPPPATGAGGFAGGDINVGSGETTVWSNDITGSIDLIKGGAGTLVLAGNDSYNGGTTISAGTLQLGNGGTSGSIIGDVKDNAFLVFDRSNDVTFNGIVSGSGSLTQAGTGTLTLTGNNTYTGGTTISAGTLQLGNGGTSGSIIGDVTDNSSLIFNRSDDITFSDVVSGTGSLEQAGAGTLTLTGNNTYTGGTTISAGKLQLGDGGYTGSIVGDVTDDGSLVFNRGDVVTFDGIVSGSGSLEQAGTGTLILTGDNTYTGGTTISAGALQLGDGHNTGSITGDVRDNGSLIFNRGDNVSFNGIVSGSGSLVKTGEGSLTLTGANTYTGDTTVEGGTLEIASGAGLGAGNIAVGSYGVYYYSDHILKVDSGVSLSSHIVLGGFGTLDNAGTLGGTRDNAVGGSSAAFATVMNHDGGSIEGKDSAVVIDGYSTVENSSGGIIAGGNLGVGMSAGGSITNDGADSIIRSLNGTAIRISGETGTVANTAGGTITSNSTAIYLQHGGTVSNGAGSTIKATGARDGDCGGTGVCSVYVASGDSTDSTSDGGLTLNNAGNIVGNVQMISTSHNGATLSAGGSIQGDLLMGSNNGSFLTLNGDAGTTQLYSQAVTGKTTFEGLFLRRAMALGSSTVMISMRLRIPK